MPKRMRRKLLTPKNKKRNNVTPKQTSSYNSERETYEVTTPRGRLKGALKEALEPGDNESDYSLEKTSKKGHHRGADSQSNDSSSSEDERRRGRQQSPQRYVLKLFDRSVDLSQFEEDSPLYPICRAWIANQPRMKYKKFGKKKSKPHSTEDSVELPGPVGPPVSRIPKLIPEQLQACKDNINLNYREAPPPPGEALIAQHSARWAGVRRAWLDQAARVEARYEATQLVLNKISLNGI